MNTIKHISSHNMAGGNYWHVFQSPSNPDNVVVMHDECVWTQNKANLLAYVADADDLVTLEQDTDAVDLEYMGDDYDSTPEPTNAEHQEYRATLDGLTFSMVGDTVTVTAGDLGMSFDYYQES